MYRATGPNRDSHSAVRGKYSGKMDCDDKPGIEARMLPKRKRKQPDRSRQARGKNLDLIHVLWLETFAVA